MDSHQLVQHITKGKSNSKTHHSKGIARLSEAQAKTIAECKQPLVTATLR